MTVNLSSNTTAATLFVDENTRRSDNISAFCQVAAAIILCATSWNIVSMAVYGKKTKRWKNTKRGRIYIVAFAAICMLPPGVIVHLILFQATIIPGVSDNCELLADLVYFFYGTAIFATYFFLWVRQRTLYAEPFMKRLQGKCLTTSSWLLLAGLVVAFIITLCSVLIPHTTIPTDIGCVHTPPENRTDTKFLVIWMKYENYVALAMAIAIQITFLCLFAYPLVKHKFEKKSGVKTAGKDTIMRQVKRSMICTLIAIITDILMIGLGKIAHYNEHPFAVVLTVYLFDIFVNNICILGTFNCFKPLLTVLFSYCCDRDSQTNPEAETANANTEITKL